MLEACIADVPGLCRIAMRRDCGKIEKQSVTRTDLEMGESVRIAADEIIAEKTQHRRVVAPPQLRRKQSVHVTGHQIRVRVHFRVRLRKRRQPVASGPPEMQFLIEHDSAHPAVVLADAFQVCARNLHHLFGNLFGENQFILAGGRKTLAQKRSVCGKRRELAPDQSFKLRKSGWDHGGNAQSLSLVS